VNIKDLPQGSYKVIGGQPPIQPSQSGMVNVRDLPQNSYKVLSGQMPEAPQLPEAPQQGSILDVNNETGIIPDAWHFTPTDVGDRTDAGVTTATIGNQLKSVANLGIGIGKFLDPLANAKKIGMAITSAVGYQKQAEETKIAQQGVKGDIPKLQEAIKKNKATGKDTSNLERLLKIASGQQVTDTTFNLDVVKEAPKALYENVATEAIQKIFKGDIHGGVQSIAEDPQQLTPYFLGGKKFIEKKLPGVDKGISYIAKPIIENLNPLPITKAVIGKVEASQKNYKANAVNRITQKLEEELLNIENNYSKTRKAMDFSKDSNASTRKMAAEAPIWDKAVDENGLLRTKQKGGAVDQYEALTISGKENLVRNDLAREGYSIKPQILEQKLKTNIENNPLIKGKAKTAALKNIDEEIAAYKRDPAGNIPLTEIHDAKIATYKVVKDFATPAEYKTYQKSLGNGLKKTIEDTSDLNIAEINGEIGKYRNVVKYLENLDGARVKGAKLGKYAANIAGHITGAAIGSIAGPFGAAVVSAAGGAVATKLQGRFLQNTIKGIEGGSIPKNPILEAALQRSQSPKEGMTVADYQRFLSREGTQTNQYNAAPTNVPNTISNIPTTLPQLGTKVKAGDIKVNDFQKGISVISKESLAKTAKELAEKKSSGLIKVTDYTKPQYPRYITPDMQNRMAKVLTLKENQGKSVDMLVLEVQKKFVDIDGITPGEQDIRKMIVDMRDVKKKVNLTPGIKNVEAKGAVGAKEAVAKGMTEEQYVKGQGTPLYHGTLTKFNAENIKPSKGTQGTGIYLDLKKETATRYAKGGEVLEFAGQDLKLADTTKFTKAQSEQFSIAYENAVKKLGEHSDEATNIAYKSMGFDGKKITNTEIMLFDSSKVKTTSQLRAEYKAAKALTPNK